MGTGIFRQPSNPIVWTGSRGLSENFTVRTNWIHWNYYQPLCQLWGGRKYRHHQYPPEKNNEYGTNGSLITGFNQGYYAKHNTGISLNHRSKNINLYGNYYFNEGKDCNILSLYRTVADSLFGQRAVINFNNTSHNFKAGIDFPINTRFTIGAMVNGSLSTTWITNNGTTPISYLLTGITDPYPGSQQQQQPEKKQYECKPELYL